MRSSVGSVLFDAMLRNDRHWPLQLCATSRRSPLPQTSAENKEAMIDALYASPEVEVWSGANTDEDSHLHLERLEDGEPALTRFTYVDEHVCIGCTYCASIARSTFFMEENHGRARVFDQGGDSEELVAEAIDSCPVSCIHYVSYEDLIILENERRGQRINNANRLVSQQECTSDAPPSKATAFDSGAMRCNNCPSKGCKECPMFGVGENPVYLERVATREEKRRQSGEAQAEKEATRREAIIGDLWSGADVEDERDGEMLLPPEVEGEVGGESRDGARVDQLLDAIFVEAPPDSDE